MSTPPFGRFLQVDEDGYLVPDLDARQLTGPWGDLVRASVEVYQRIYGEALHSVYVRGSVARGLAVEGLSDVDTWAVLHGTGTGGMVSCPPELGAEEAALGARWSGCTEVELCVSHLERVLREPRGSFARTLLALQATCVHGDDIVPTLPRVRPGPEAFGAVWFVSGAMATVQEEVPGETSPTEVAGWCRWIAKAWVRAAFELVMADDQRWTRDVELCALAVGQHRPEHAAGVAALGRLVVDPLTDAGALMDVAASPTVAWILDEVATLGPPPWSA